MPYHHFPHSYPPVSPRLSCCKTSPLRQLPHVIHAAAIRTAKHCRTHQRWHYGEDRIHPSRAVDFAPIYCVQLLKDIAPAM